MIENVTYEDYVIGKNREAFEKASIPFKGSGRNIFFFRYKDKMLIVGLLNGRNKLKDKITYTYRTSSIFYFGIARVVSEKPKRGALIYTTEKGVIITVEENKAIVHYTLGETIGDIFLFDFEDLTGNPGSKDYTKTELEVISNRKEFLDKVQALARSSKIIGEEDVITFSVDEPTPIFKIPSTKKRQVSFDIIDDSNESGDVDPNQLEKSPLKKLKVTSIASDKEKMKFIKCNNQQVTTYEEKKDDPEFIAKLFERLGDIHLNSLEIYNEMTGQTGRFYVGIYSKKTLRFIVNPDERDRCYNSFEVRELLRINSYDFELTTIILKEMFSKIVSKNKQMKEPDAMPLRSVPLLTIIQKVVKGATGFLAEHEVVRLIPSKKVLSLSPLIRALPTHEEKIEEIMDVASSQGKVIDQNQAQAIVEKMEEIPIKHEEKNVLYFVPQNFPSLKNYELDMVVEKAEHTEIDENRFKDDISMVELSNLDEDDSDDYEMPNEADLYEKELEEQDRLKQEQLDKEMEEESKIMEEQKSIRQAWNNDHIHALKVTINYGKEYLHGETFNIYYVKKHKVDDGGDPIADTYDDRFSMITLDYPKKPLTFIHDEEKDYEQLPNKTFMEMLSNHEFDRSLIIYSSFNQENLYYIRKLLIQSGIFSFSTTELLINPLSRTEIFIKKNEKRITPSISKEQDELYRTIMKKIYEAWARSIVYAVRVSIGNDQFNVFFCHLAKKNSGMNVYLDRLAIITFDHPEKPFTFIIPSEKRYDDTIITDNDYESFPNDVFMWMLKDGVFSQSIVPIDEYRIHDAQSSLLYSGFSIFKENNFTLDGIPKISL